MNVVSVNGEAKQLSENGTVIDLLKLMNLEHAKGFALAVNDEVVAREEWDCHTLKNNDSILLITATQGG